MILLVIMDSGFPKKIWLKLCRMPKLGVYVTGTKYCVLKYYENHRATAGFFKGDHGFCVYLIKAFGN